MNKYVTKAALDKLLFLGKPITSYDMLNWGLVNRVFPSDSIEEESIACYLK